MSKASPYRASMMLALAGFLVLGSLLGRAYAQQAAAQQAAPPPAVSVVKLEERSYTPSRTFNGRLEAVDKVDLIARIQGFLEKRLFEEGKDVKSGDLLFVIEKAPYEASVQETEARIVSAKATLQLAQLDRDRQATLVKRDAASQARLDEAIARLGQAQGDLMAQEASLTKAKLDLGYTEIRAPFDGRIGATIYSIGSYLTPSSGALATIVSQDPMYVNFPVTQRDLLEVRSRAEKTGKDPTKVTVRLRLADNSIYPETGHIDFVNIKMDPGTDTVQVRASIPNPSQTLIDGQLVTVVVATDQPRRVLMVPQQAVQLDQGGRFVLTLDGENKVQVRRIVVGSEIGGLYVVEQGLAAGDRVITEGIQKVRPGAVVTPTEVPLPQPDAQG